MKKFYRYLVFFGFFIWIAETAFFGFNEKPINNLERFLDIISWVCILWGIVGDIASNLHVKKEYNFDIITNRKSENTIESLLNKYDK